MFTSISLISLFLSFIGMYLNAYKKISCWAFWITANIFWEIHAFQNNDYASMILWFIFTMFDIYGWYRWRKDK